MRRNRASRGAFALAAMLLLGACSSEPVPEIAYYTLPPLTAVPERAAPVFKAPISIDSFLADGVYNEQGVLYLSLDHRNLRAYHYQLWQDPPTRMLQRRLIDTLRARRLSDLVADRLPSSAEQINVLGLVRRFDRVQGEDGWHAMVQLELRIERGSAKTPLLVKKYVWALRALHNSIQATVEAFKVSVDQCFGAFAHEARVGTIDQHDRTRRIRTGDEGFGFAGLESNHHDKVRTANVYGLPAGDEV
jgi:uncharacterized lipoprotein YmbA